MMNFKFSSLDTRQIMQLYRKNIRHHRRGRPGALREAAECRIVMAQRCAFRNWLSQSANSLPMH
jgi:hypothetical protein